MSITHYVIFLMHVSYNIDSLGVRSSVIAQTNCVLNVRLNNE